VTSYPLALAVAKADVLTHAGVSLPPNAVENGCLCWTAEIESRNHLVSNMGATRHGGW